MEPVKRIIVNTTAQYIRAIVNTILSLYSTRLILDALNIHDYGIYSLVAGIVSMLGFVANSLVITTQRYISFYHGRSDMKEIRKIFANSLFLHLVLGLIICGVIFSLRSILMDNVLNIESNRIQTAGQVYGITVLMLFITIITAPFKALFIARENIVYISVVEILDGVLKVIAAIFLLQVDVDKLLVYTCILAAILMANLLAYIIYGVLRFPECRLGFSLKYIDMKCIRLLLGFAGWTTFGMGAVVARTQGISVIFNHFMGTVVNAAYGIAFQAYNAVAFIATSVMNAMNPQIVKAEGAKKREHMLYLASMESKYSVMLLAIFLIPIMVVLPDILGVWLKKVPDNTAMFCRFVFVAFILDQLTIGLNVVNQALGKIRNYSLLMYTPKLLILPVAYWIMYNGYSMQLVMWLYITVEFVVALMRIPYIHHTAGLDMKKYSKEVICPLIPLFITLALVAWGCSLVFIMKFGVICTLVISVFTGVIAAWIFTLNVNERDFVRNLIKKKIRNRND